MHLKKYLLGLFSMGCSIASLAQVESNTFGFTLGPEVGLPSGNLKGSYSFSIGGYGQLNIGLFRQLQLTTTVSYANFFPNGSFGQKSSQILSLLGGVAINASETVNINASVGNGSFYNEGSSISGLLYSAGMGFNFQSIYLGLNYNSLKKDNFSFEWVNLKFGYFLNRGGSDY
jgi:hypothetical protein